MFAARNLSDAEIIAIGDASLARRFSCGHPKIAENLLRVEGLLGVRCRICSRRAERRS